MTFRHPFALVSKADCPSRPTWAYEVTPSLDEPVSLPLRFAAQPPQQAMRIPWHRSLPPATGAPMPPNPIECGRADREGTARLRGDGRAPMEVTMSPALVAVAEAVTDPLSRKRSIMKSRKLRIRVARCRPDG
jgi:hypothetical protein